MWNSIKGQISQKRIDGIFLDSGMLEWDISTSNTSLEAWPGIGSEIRVYTYLQHTEDQMKLYGFSSVQERALFLDLLKVNGVGPKLALKILSGLKPQQLEKALEAGDTSVLSKTPGVGLKTAQKIILALKGKLSLEDTADEILSAKVELVQSLIEMGFDKKRVEKAVDFFWNSPEVRDLPIHEKEKVLFQKALMKLTKEG